MNVDVIKYKQKNKKINQKSTVYRGRELVKHNIWYW